MTREQIDAQIAKFTPEQRNQYYRLLGSIKDLGVLEKINLSKAMYTTDTPSSIQELWSLTGLYLTALNLAINEQQKQIDRLTLAIIGGERT